MTQVRQSGRAHLGVGEEAEPWVLENLSRTHLVKYAGASGDFNPMHHDDTLARAVGYPSVFAHGMLSAGLLSTYLVRWIGVGNLRRFWTQFRKQVWPGDDLRFSAKVVRRYEVDGESRVDIECSVLRQNGDLAIKGEASAAVAP